MLILVHGIAKIHARAELARVGLLGEVGRKRALTCGTIGGFATVVNSFAGLLSLAHHMSGSIST
jgi:hypothetical protein